MDVKEPRFYFDFTMTGNTFSRINNIMVIISPALSPSPPPLSLSLCLFLSLFVSLSLSLSPFSLFVSLSLFLSLFLSLSLFVFLFVYLSLSLSLLSISFSSLRPLFFFTFSDIPLFCTHIVSVLAHETAPCCHIEQYLDLENTVFWGIYSTFLWTTSVMFLIFCS